MAKNIAKGTLGLERFVARLSPVDVIVILKSTCEPLRNSQPILAVVPFSIGSNAVSLNSMPAILSWITAVHQMDIKLTLFIAITLRVTIPVIL